MLDRYPTTHPIHPAWLYVRVKGFLILCGLLLVCFVAGCTRPVPPPLPSAVADAVAMIGETPITAQEWAQARAYSLAALRLLGEPGAALDEAAALESFVEDRFIAAEAERAGFTLPPGAAAAEEARMLQVAGASPEDLAAILQAVELSREGWLAELERAALAGRYLDEVVLAGVAPGQRAERRAAWLAAKKSELGVQMLAQLPPSVGLQVGNLAPDFTVTLLDGESMRLEELRGRGVALNFWATWCGPCLEEMPLLQQAYESRREEGLVILAVDVGEEPAQIRAFAEKLGLSFPLGLDPTQELSRRFRVFGLPTTFFIDRQGVIDYVIPGAVRASALPGMLDEILSSP